MYLSVIIPAYNEEKNLRGNIKRFNQYLARQSYDYEMIVVNDGSIDRTEEIVNELLPQIKNLRLINKQENQGKGAAVRQGLLAARGQYRLFLDADNATSIDHLEKAWPYLNQGYDIVIGSRSPKDVVGAGQVLPQSFWKRILGMGGNYFIRALVVQNIHDTQCGFKIFTQKAAENIMPRTITSRWAIDVEILALARLLTYKIAVVPVSWFNSPHSRVGAKGYFSTLKEVIKIKWYLITGKYTELT